MIYLRNQQKLQNNVWQWSMSVSVCIMYVYCQCVYIYININTYVDTGITLYEYHRVYIYTYAYLMHMLILWQSQWHKPRQIWYLLPRQSEHISWTSLWIFFINHKPEKFWITPTTIIYSDVAVRPQTQFIQMFNNHGIYIYIYIESSI